MRNILQITFIAIFSIIATYSYSQNKNNIKVANQYLEEKGEVFFRFEKPSNDLIDKLSKILSYDHYQDGRFVYAYANKRTFEIFLNYHLDYEILNHPGDLLKNPKMFSSFDKNTMAWDAYPTYDAYEAMMYQFQTNYPNLCKVYNVGTTVNGRKILFVKISDNINTHEQEARFMYTSTMHGDETTGYVTLLRLIDYLLSNYATNPKVANLVNNLEIWINPLENPDGTYKSGNTTVSGATRSNGNNVDLNRNYPNPADGDNPDGEQWQPETIAMMNLTDSIHFVMSANCHGGIEVVNYPWDTWLSSNNPHADDSWWKYVSHMYADTVHVYAPSNYMDDTSPSFDQGITHGADWYVVTGSRQDFMMYYRHQREFTLELSDTKLLNASLLPAHWDYNYRSLINYIEQTLYGLKGVVTDSLTGQPLKAHIYINSHDKDSSDVYTELPFGDYYRPLLNGTYSITYNANGYKAKTFNVNISNNSTTILDVQLAPTLPTANFIADNTQYCSIPASVQFINTSSDAASYLWDFGDGTTSTQTNPLHTYSNYGDYTVKLIAYGVFGGQDTITISNFISVNSSNPCIYNMLTSGSSSSTDCIGILYDSGGMNNYQNNTNSIFTINVSGANSITLNFESFNFENNYDYLQIYDGPNTSSTLIGSYTGTNLPNGGTIVSSSGSITIQQTSDQNTTGSGFKLNWQCTMPTSAPNADFTANKTSSCDGVIKFTDLSTNGPSMWLWNFGDGTTSIEQNPTHIYTTDGVYNVKLKVTNAFGPDSLIKSSYITVDMPTAPTTTSAVRCGAGTLSLSASGSGVLNWYPNLTTDTIINTGNTFTTPSLISTTSYYVASSISNPSQFVNSPDNTTNGSFHNSSQYYILFDVFEKLTLKSVEINKQAAGNVSIALVNSSGVTLQSKTVSANAGISRVQLDFAIEPGTNYGLRLTSSGQLWRNNNGVNFPYEISGLISLKTTTAGTGLYYYFYDWEVQPAPCLSPRTIVTATINQNPTLNLGQDVSSCEGENVIINGPNGFTYNWSTGSTNQNITVTQSGNYSLTITDSNSCSSNDNVNVVFNSNPSIELGNNISSCVGNTETISAPNGYTYNWSNGSTDETIDVTTNGTYSVTITDSNQCSNSDFVNVIFNQLPTIFLGMDTTICATYQLTLDAGSGFASYEWSNSSTSQTINVSNTGIYSVTVTDSNNCSNSDDIYVTANPSIYPNFTYLNTNGVVSFTNTTLNGNSYIWDFNNGNTSTDVNPTTSYSTSGTYNVKLIATNDCGTDSVVIPITVIITSDVSNNDLKNLISIYPNPFNDEITISSDLVLIDYNIIIRNIIGEEVYNSKIDNESIIKIDLNNFSNGIYSITLESADGIIIRKLIKQ